MLPNIVGLERIGILMEMIRELGISARRSGTGNLHRALSAYTSEGLRKIWRNIVCSLRLRPVETRQMSGKQAFNNMNAQRRTWGYGG